MRLWVTVLVSAAVFLASSRPAAASDAGDVTASDAGDAAPADAAAADASAASVADASASDMADLEVGDSGEQAETAPVIACDGALCDTTQGRPTCMVAARSAGRSAVDPSPIAGVLALLVAALVRRSRRGT